MNVSTLSGVTSATATFKAQRLTEARDFKGLKMTDLASLVGVTRQAISGFEAGIHVPSSETLSRIATVLGFSREFFIDNEEYSTELIGPLFFRSNQTTKKRSRASSKIQAQWTARAFEKIEAKLTLPDVKLPSFDIYDFETLNDDEIEEIAIQTRNFFGLGLGPISNMTLLLENNGIPVVFSNSSDKVHGFSFGTNTGRKFIVIDNKSSGCRTRFSIAHELGHLILHKTLDVDFLTDKELFKLVEKQADLFASAFLMPLKSFSSEFYSSKLDALQRMKKRWKTSLAAIGMRAKQLRLINDNQMGYIWRQLASYRKIEPLDNVILPEQPSYMKTALGLLEDHNILLKSDFVRLLKLPIDEVAQIFNVSINELREKEIANVIHFTPK